MNNKTFRLFISSTFEDFQQERIIINNEIAPKLEEHCKSKGYHFQIIDMRWGIASESVVSQKTLEICLEEVKRCRRFSPKPNFLLMVGNRYGWIPLPYSVEKTEFESILFAADQQQKNLLKNWYELNENTIPATYYLKKREGVYLNEAKWLQTEAELRSCLQEIASKCGLDELHQHKYFASATEQEIIEGVFFSQSTAANAIALFKKSIKKSDVEDNKPSVLKERVIDFFSKNNQEKNIIDLAEDGRYYETFSQELLSIIIENIDSEIERLNSIAKKNSYEEVLEFYTDDLKNFHHRDKELKEFSKLIKNSEHNITFLHGSSGGGKSTFLAKFLSQTTAKCFCCFYGLNNTSFSLASAIDALCIEICSHFQINDDVFLGNESFTGNFINTINKTPPKDIFIVIDGMESMYDVNTINEQIFPHRIPSHIHIIISSADSKLIQSFSDSYNSFTLDSFAQEQSVFILHSYLKSKNFQLVNQQQIELCKSILEADSTPLKVRLVADYCRIWHSCDENIHLSKNEEEIVLDYFESMTTAFSHNRTLVLYSLAFIAASPFGITEHELQTLLFRIKEIKEYFVKEDKHNYQLNYIPLIYWSRLAYDMEPAITYTVFNGEIVVKLSHSIFYSVIKKYHPAIFAQARSMLIRYYGDMSTFFDNAHSPNFRKIKILPNLLYTENQNEALLALLTDDIFADASIRCKELKELMQYLTYLKSLQNPADSRLESLLNLLQRNYYLLSVYRNEYNNINSSTDTPIIQNLTTQRSENAFFPINSGSAFAYNPQTDEIAFSSGSFIAVYQHHSAEEKTKIFSESNSEIIPIELQWIGAHLLLAHFPHDVYIYSVVNRRPVTIFSKHSKNEISTVRYHKKLHYLLYQIEKNIYCYDIIQKRLIYTYKYKSLIEYYFDIQEDDSILGIKKGNSLLLYNIANGQLIKKQRFNLPTTVKTAQYLKSYSNQIFLFYSNGSCYAYYNHDRVTYYCPPFAERIRSCLIGRNSIVFVYDTLLLLLNTANNKVYYYPVDFAFSAFWEHEDQSVFLTSDGFIKRITLSDFINVPFLEQTIASTKNTLKYGSIRAKKRSKDIKSLTQYLLLLFNISKEWDFPLTIINNMDLLIDKNYSENNSATLFVESYAGYTATAFERQNAVVINHKEKIEISNLHIGLFNNILRMMFSDDSNWFLLWLNQRLLVINLKRMTKYIDISTLYKPIENVYFSSDSSKLCITLPGHKHYTYSLDIGKKRHKERITLEKNKTETYLSPFIYFPDDDPPYSIIIRTLFRAKTFLEASSSKWFFNIGTYKNANLTIYYKGNHFYTESMEKYDSDGFDFMKSTIIERSLDSDAVQSYLREKNGIFSKLYSINENYAVLVHNSSNSIIVFDIQNRKIISAMKHPGIIGSKQKDSHTICVVSAQNPYLTDYKINLPE